MGVGFGLNSDEWNFLAVFIGSLLVALIPLYWSQARQRRSLNQVHREVTTNGGIAGEEPTTKDWARAAYDQALAATAAANAAGEQARRAKEVSDDARSMARVALSRQADTSQKMTNLDRLMSEHLAYADGVIEEREIVTNRISDRLAHLEHTALGLIGHAETLEHHAETLEQVFGPSIDGIEKEEPDGEGDGL